LVYRTVVKRTNHEAEMEERADGDHLEIRWEEARLLFEINLGVVAVE